MLIAQLTDLHIGFRPGVTDEPNLLRLRAALHALTHRPDRPDLLLLTGDLTEHGDAQSYAVLAAELAALPFAVEAIPGNHDDRANLAAAFGMDAAPNGFLHRALSLGQLRVVLLDTLEPGRHGGAFCKERADWLEAELSAHADRPTLIALHHPPVPVGIDWMDPAPDADWIVRLGAVLTRHDQVQALTCGHLHRAVFTRFAGRPLLACPSAAPALALDLGAIDPDTPDLRAMVLDEPPGLALHRWDGTRLVSHFAAASDARVLARYDSAFQGVVRAMKAEQG